MVCLIKITFKFTSYFTSCIQQAPWPTPCITGVKKLTWERSTRIEPLLIHWATAGIQGEQAWNKIVLEESEAVSHAAPFPQSSRCQTMTGRVLWHHMTVQWGNSPTWGATTASRIVCPKRSVNSKRYIALSQVPNLKTLYSSYKPLHFSSTAATARPP